MIYSQKMIFLLLLIAALASELVKSDSSESAERRHGQWGQDRNWWGHGGNQWRHGRNHGEHGGDLRGQSGSHREHDGNQRGHGKFD